MRHCAVVILCTFVVFVQSAVVWRDVEITQGTVRGHLDPNGGLFVFYNVPYATAPIGPEKFKAPLPPPVFRSTFYAVDKGIVCPQPGGMMNMREDCLVANVFVPGIRTGVPTMPVLVIVHGGAYQYGYGEQDKFIELAKIKRAIVVTFNYRIGVHGFLCLGTEDIPGNAGIKDQVALLRWVKTNIHSFGGDPEDVTLTADTSGSSSVDFITLSTITKGLFNEAILQSGVSAGTVGVQIDPIENAKTYAKELGFKGDGLSSLEDFYKSATFQQLLMRHNDQDSITSNLNVVGLFGPCVMPDPLKDDPGRDFQDQIYKKRTTKRPVTRPTSAPIVTSKPVTGATTSSGSNPVTIKPITTYTTSTSTTNFTTTSSSLNVTNTTTFIPVEWTTYPSIILPPPVRPPVSGVADSLMLSKFMILVIYLSFYLS